MDSVAIIKSEEYLKSAPPGAIEVIPNDRIKLLPSQQEKILKKMEYRKKYRNRPDVKARREEYLNKPEVKAKRELYNKDNKVKERKKFLSKLRRAVLRCFIQEHGELYEKFKAKCEFDLSSEKKEQ